MSKFKKSVITDAGMDLIKKNVATTFTRAIVSSDVLDENTLQSMTELRNIKAEYPISTYASSGANLISLSFRISNLNESDGFFIRNIGIYANDPDVGEVLYSVAVAEDDMCEYLPPYNGLKESVIKISFYAAVSNSNNVNVNQPPAGDGSGLGTAINEISISEIDPGATSEYKMWINPATGEQYVKNNGMWIRINVSAGMTTEQSQQLSRNTTDISHLKEDIGNLLSKSGHGSNKYLGTDSTGNVVEKEPPTPIINNYTETVENPYTLPVATETILGGIKALPKTDLETVEVKIGADGKLYVPPTQGGVLDISQIASQLEIQPSVDEAGDMTFSIVAKQTGGTV